MQNKFFLYILLGVLLCGSSFSLQTKTKSPHGDLKTNCIVCHTSDSWSIDTQRSNFKHDETGFRLTKAHQKAPCAACHKSSDFFKVGTSCADCHQDVHKGKMGVSCETCHDNNGWDNRKIKKDSIHTHQDAGFPLIGMHARLDCSQCHRNNQYRGTNSECYACHAAKYQATSAPNHGALHIGTNCNQCHTGFSWQKAFYSHNRFPLTGTHKTTPCSSCHISGYTGTPSTCFGCHATNYNNTTNPNHTASGINTTCETCHSTTAWTPATFSHNNFPLTGTHRTTACSACHTSGYTGTPTTCFACHATNYSNTTNPNHTASGINTTCQTCHSTTAWTPATFSHTNFPLTGAHQTTACSACHTSGYTGTPTTCFACHSTNYNNTTNPKHSTAGINTTCQTCHTTTAWTPASFAQHDSYFKIYSGKHKNRWSSCTQCHPTSYPTYSCNSCHSNAHHQGSNCLSCHS